MRKFLFFSALIFATVYVGTKGIGRVDLIKSLPNNSVKIQCIDLSDYSIKFWKWAKVCISVNGKVFYNYTFLDQNEPGVCARCFSIDRMTINMKNVNGFSVDLNRADKTSLVLRNFSSDFYGVFKCRSSYEFRINGQSSMITVKNEQDGEIDLNGNKQKPPGPLKLTVG